MKEQTTLLHNVSPATLLSHLRMPLYRNAYALLLSGLASAGLGMLYWLLAARSYSTESVGLNSAAISTMMLVSGLAQLSLYGALVRFIPIAGRGTRALVIAAYGISTAAGIVVCVIFSLGLNVWAPSLGILTTSPAFLAVFVASTLAWIIFSLQDGVLTGLRQSTWVPLENILAGIGKIVLLFALAEVNRDYGIFIAWMAPVMITILPINLLIFRRFIPQHAGESAHRDTSLAPRDIVRYVSGNYLGTLFSLASTTLMPIIVVGLAGTTANAHFYISWMIATGLQLIALNMTTSFTVEASRDPTVLGIYLYRTFLQGMRLLVPFAGLVVLGAPLILGLFGKSYADEGTTLLRLLAISTLPNMIVALYLSLNRVRNRMTAIVITQGGLSVLLLGLSVALLPIYGITGVGLASLISQTCIAALTLLTPLRSALQVGRQAHRLTPMPAPLSESVK